jgi:benzylsuccinate CoA-transferase BbsE subunit/naphthyl-2-methylsuccinate CoA transferase subunit
VRSPDNQAYRMAEAYAAVGSTIALFGAQRSGKGQFVDVACIEAGAGALENAAQFWDLEGKIRRGRGKEAGTATIHPCADGYIAIVAIMGKNKVMWTPFVEWMKQEGVAEWEVFDNDKWIESAYRESKEGYDTFCRIFERYTMQHDKRYIYETGQGYSVAVTPVSNGKDLLENPQLKVRGYWQTVPNETLGGDVVYPGAPYEFGEIRWRQGGSAPRLGQHTREILAGHGYAQPDIDALIKAGAVYAE